MANSLAELRVLLRVSLRLQNHGAVHSKLSHARGQVDGYMQALLDAGLTTRTELLRLVAEERAMANGPSTRDCQATERESLAA